MDRLSPPNIHVLKLIMSYTLNKYSVCLSVTPWGSWRHPISRAVPHKAQLKHVPSCQTVGPLAALFAPTGQDAWGQPVVSLQVQALQADPPWSCGPSTHFSPCSMSSLPNKMGICHEALKSENCFWGYSLRIFRPTGKLVCPWRTWAPPSPSLWLSTWGWKEAGGRLQLCGHMMVSSPRAGWTHEDVRTQKWINWSCWQHLGKCIRTGPTCGCKPSMLNQTVDHRTLDFTSLKISTRINVNLQQPSIVFKKQTCKTTILIMNAWVRRDNKLEEKTPFRSQLFHTKEKLRISHCLEMSYKYIFMD